MAEPFVDHCQLAVIVFLSLCRKELITKVDYPSRFLVTTAVWTATNLRPHLSSMTWPLQHEPVPELLLANVVLVCVARAIGV